MNLLDFENRLFTRQRLLVWGGAAVICGAIMQGNWVLDGSGSHNFIDFVWLWCGGKLALQGQAMSAYDYQMFSAAQEAMVSPERGIFPYYHWIYPPTLFFFIAPFALLPYLAGYLAWVATSLSIYLKTLYAILPRKLTLPLALTPVAAMCNISLGHTGFLSTALIGLTVTLMHRRPLLAGICLGLLTFKPQYGLIFPFVLVAGGYWRVIAGAMVTIGVLVCSTAAVFGLDTWVLFFQTITSPKNNYLMPDIGLSANLQTPYGLAIWLGFCPIIAWRFHFVVAATCIIWVCVFWKRQASHSLKAAMLTVSVLLVTPYALWYDLIIFVLPGLFLVKDALASGFLPGERSVILGCFWALYAPVWPVGPIVGVVLMALIYRRSRRKASYDNVHLPTGMQQLLPS